MALKISFGLFLIFFSNVFYASVSNVSLLSDVQEFLLLCVSVAFFVIGIIKAEKELNEK